MQKFSQGRRIRRSHGDYQARRAVRELTGGVLAKRRQLILVRFVQEVKDSPGQAGAHFLREEVISLRREGQADSAKPPERQTQTKKERLRERQIQNTKRGTQEADCR